jgi:PncC family amidohydrolase
MAAGARRMLGADLAVATTGIAGPDGATEEKPVGLVYFALSHDRGTRSWRYQFNGQRQHIQNQCVTVALNMLRLKLIDRLDLLQSSRQSGAGGPVTPRR